MSIGLGAAIAGALLAMAWMVASEENSKAKIAKACLENHGTFSYTWNWKPYCEMKAR
jgi:hypothetical protein